MAPLHIARSLVPSLLIGSVVLLRPAAAGADPPAPEPAPAPLAVTVPSGALVLSTPYTPENPLDLGTLHLTSDGTSFYSDDVLVGSPPAGDDGILVTDTRPGRAGWTMSMVTSDFSNGIDDFTGNTMKFRDVTPIYLPGNAIQDPDVDTDDISAFTTPKTFARSARSPGSVHIAGLLSISGVPTSVRAGGYTATITITVI